MLAHSFQTRIGALTVMEEDGRICRLTFGSADMTEDVPTDLLKKAESQIIEYLNGRRWQFDLPLSLPDEGFSRDVLEAMLDIPYGSTMTYGKLAEVSGHPGAARAVGTVCSGNRIPIIIPCHRVVPASGGNGRYSGPEGMKDILLGTEFRADP